MITTTNSPGTLVDDAGVGTIAWSNPGNASASDDSRAVTASLSSSAISHYLKCTGFGFAIPSGHAIFGIQALLEWRGAGTAGARENRLRIVKAGSIGSSTAHDGSSDLPGSDAVEAFGGYGDLWGETWTPADVNDSGFGLAVSCRAPIIFSGTAEVDQVRLAVLHGFPATGSRLLTGVG